MPGHLLKGNPVEEGTTRRGTDTLVHRPEKPAYNSEAQAGIKIAGRNINNLKYADDTTLTAESEELKSLLMKVKKESEKVGFKLNIQKTTWRREWQPIPAFLPGKSHGQRSLAGYTSHGRKKSEMTEVM